VNATQLHQAIMNLPSKKTTWASRFLHAAYDVGHKEALHAAAELVLAAGLPQWLPIESAPKDGTRVLVYRDFPGLEKVIEIDKWWPAIGRWQKWPWNHPDEQPTHWLPLTLPLPPEGEER
jgi:hypothetical protein